MKPQKILDTCAELSAVRQRRSTVEGTLVIDRRVARTRSALERSFDEIFMTEGYDKSTPARVAEGAEVGRSTFYEHFGGKEDIFEQRLSRILRPLGEAVCSEAVPGDLEPTLDHFWAKRLIVRPLLAGRSRIVTMRALTTLIEARMPDPRADSPVPKALIAAQIAGGQLSLLEEWLSGCHRCSSGDLAHALANSARATALSYA